MTTNNKLEWAKTSLLGLSVGDAFGETFFGPADDISLRISGRVLLSGAWPFTDDTVMSIGIYNILSKFGTIDQDELAKEFVNNYLADENRGYGATARRILRNISEGGDWIEESNSVFDGMGSAGNGAAMRSGPIGAYFHEDTAAVIEQATLAARVTHAHEEGVAGGIAVALAACICTRYGLNKQSLPADTFYDFVIDNMPASRVRSKIQKAKTLPAGYDIRTIVSVLGNGTNLSADDTVPLSLWCVANNTGSYEEAIWAGLQALGDRDTIAAIIGSIVVLSAGADSIPAHWIKQAESFSDSIFFNKTAS
jgi:ADP-ribosylglycohydrolase